MHTFSFELTGHILTNGAKRLLSFQSLHMRHFIAQLSAFVDGRFERCGISYEDNLFNITCLPLRELCAPDQIYHSLIMTFHPGELIIAHSSCVTMLKKSYTRDEAKMIWGKSTGAKSS